MTDTYYLAIDIGASSGRHILGYIQDGKLLLEEIHRFPNNMVEKEGRLCWDMAGLFQEVLAGIARCRELGKAPQSLGIDTWGVDFALLDKAGKQLGSCIAYRDSRTTGIPEELFKTVSEGELYARTGIQFQVFNTIYQLLAMQKEQPGSVEQAEMLLLIPEYLSYLLTGKVGHEYTNATTTGLVDAKTKTWDQELLQKIGIPSGILGTISPPGTSLGNLLPEVREKVGFDCRVTLPCTHDTGSAVLAAPLEKNSIYLSSGTWSLMGVELSSPICTEESRRCNFTNEGGYGDTIRYLKNIMGLWMIQQVKREYGAYSFAELESAAREEPFPARIYVNDQRFLAPKSMIKTIQDVCASTGQMVPNTPGELMSCIYHSLAESYSQTVRELERLTGKTYDTICIVGGGSKDSYLAELTALKCRKRVTTGPTEGTAVGNLLVQMLQSGELTGVPQARELVRRSFAICEYKV